jgi:predicted  nucleic acid-binding Zn-ribbon protein
VSRTSSLFRLQSLDSELERRRSLLREIEAVLSDSEASSRSHQALAQAETQLQAARAAVHAEEGTLAAHRAKIEEAERSLYGGAIQNPKELQDLQREVESLQRYRPTLEDRLLEAMLGLEEAETAQRGAQEELQRVEQLQATRNEALMAKRDEARAEIERLESEREAALGDVPEQDLELYLQLRTSRGGLAVALLEDDSCGACGLIQSHSSRQSIRMANDLHLCKQCGRILYAG